jgi:hypothetical protein
VKKKKRKREKRTENLSPFSLALLPFPSVVTADARPSQFIASIIRFSDFATSWMQDTLFFLLGIAAVSLRKSNRLGEITVVK